MKKIFLHGFMGSGQDWNISEGLKPDLPGFGKNLSLPKNRDELFEKLTQQFIQEYKIGPDDWIIGYSLGGRVAMELVYRYQLPVAGCLIFCAHPGLISNHERDERKIKEAAWIEGLSDREDFLRKWYQNPLFKCLSKDSSFEALLKRRMSDSGQYWAQSFDYYSLALQPDLRPLISASNVPLTYVVGKEDHKFLQIGRELKESCPTISLLELEGVDHGIPWQIDLKNFVESIINK